MSQTEQKFDCLCSLAKKLNISIVFCINEYGRYTIRIERFYDTNVWKSKVWTNQDEVITEALCYLRKINKQQIK